ncbi:SGNH/GDSL hydrolase family protein [Mucilaginibacter gotjawali]|uniref:Lysophospholipase L1-like esterase n=2 Tax=Mucilaginibacter gotjawali TaxID=1550579 RepID=A0A839SB08_9SPHI|nr:SGNH/GDSL hydrolase family protein [Mucilaginibacter gotjawali]MBB3055275.1 lysophospholipase L1-like esterase [Mucilaginibacter gotjawali]BAU56106.1 GDSL-like Lipase/Acylhydrolase [Mucilaginibacter gotjawali]
MKTLQIILIAITALSGCNKKADVARLMTVDTTTKTKPMTDSLSYLALGDSYTIGEAVPSAESYPYQLTSALRDNSFNVEIPKIIATTGWTTDNLIAAIAKSGITSKKFNFVTLLIGVNDQFQGLSQDNYKIKFAQVLNTAITFANGDTSRVFVLSIPDYGVTPFAGGRDGEIGPEIDQFNAINKSISLKAGVNYLDITAISRTAANDPTLIAPDGLHPSGKMYLLWVKQLAPMLATELKK